jgi:glycosyltransferase involved in cell wall biosynthesis
MNSKKVLIIYSRNIAINDSGASRTTIELANYIASKKDYLCYCYFKIIEGNNGRVIEIYDKELTKKNLNNFIIENNIDILLVPEAEILLKIANKATQRTKCKIVSAFHNKPGYEKMGLYTLLKESFLYNSNKIKRLRSLILILFFPISYTFYTTLMTYKVKNAYILSDFFVLHSERFFSEFKKSYKIKNDEKLVAIGNALSFNYFIRSEEIEKKKKQILVVARLDERQKRISIILKIWELIFYKYPDWELLIVGSGRSETFYNKLMKKMKLERCYFLGHKDPKQYYMESSIFLMTSAFEGWTMTLTEAQQYGCVPVVMDSFSVVHDIIKSESNGIISPNNDINSFVIKTKKLMDDKVYRKTLALNGVESSKQFSHFNVSEKWIRLFDKIINNI